METTSKKCSACGVLHTLDNYRLTKLSPDGHAKSVSCVLSIEEYKNTTRLRGWGNPELAKFTPRDLIEELKARGYSGTLTITKEIKL